MSKVKLTPSMGRLKSPYILFLMNKNVLQFSLLYRPEEQVTLILQVNVTQMRLLLPSSDKYVLKCIYCFFIIF